MKGKEKSDAEADLYAWKDKYVKGGTKTYCPKTLLHDSMMKFMKLLLCDDLPGKDKGAKKEKKSKEQRFAEAIEVDDNNDIWQSDDETYDLKVKLRYLLFDSSLTNV